MRLFPRFVRAHARILCATLAATLLAASGTVFAQFATYDSAYDVDLWTVRQDLVPPTPNATPQGVVFLNGNLYVVDSANSTILVYNSAGTLVPMPAGSWSAPGFAYFTLSAVKVKVNGAAIDTDALLLSDHASNRVAAFDTTGQPLFTLTLTRPYSNTLYSISTNQTAMAPGSRFDLTTGPTPQLKVTGTFVAGWSEQWLAGPVHSAALVYRDVTFSAVAGGFETGAATLLDGRALDPVMPNAKNIFGVAYDQNGNLFLLDTYTERFHAYDSNLQQLFSFGTPDLDLTTTEFIEPWGLAYWPDASGNLGRVFIVNTYNDSIDVYRTVDSNADGKIDNLSFQYNITDFGQQPDDFPIWGFGVALDTANRRIALTEQPPDPNAPPSDQPPLPTHVHVLGLPRLSTFNVQSQDTGGNPIDTVCIGTPYKVQMSITVPAGGASVTGVAPTLAVNGIAASGAVAAATYASDTLAAGDVVTYTYSLTAPSAIGGDLVIEAGATATNTTDILHHVITVPLADCAADTSPTTWTVAPAYSDQLQVSGWTAIYPGQNYSVDLTATDANLVEAIQYRLEGANSTGSATVTTSIATPASSASISIALPLMGRTTIKYRAQDGNHIWSPWLSYSVRPKLVAPQMALENDAVEFRVGDPEGTGFTYSVNRVPAGVQFSSETGQFTGVVSFDAHDPFSTDPVVKSGIYQVIVTETAPGGATSSSQFTWTITHVNRPPTITNPPNASFAVKKGDPVNIQITGYDPDGDPVFFTIQGHGTDTAQDINAWLQIDRNTGLITGAFGDNADSHFSIFIGLAECGPIANPPCSQPYLDELHLATQYTIDIGVLESNLPPDLLNPGTQTSAEGAAVNFLLQSSDAEGDALTFTAGGLPPGLGIDPSTGRISGTVGFNTAGTYAVTVDITDGHHPKRSIVFDWVVTHTNRPPVILAPDRFNLDGDTVSGLLTGVSDPDGDVVTLHATGLPPGVLMTTSGIFTGTIPYLSFGDYPVILTASDGELTSTGQFVWHVQKVNRPPDIDLANRTDAEGDVVSFTLHGTDPDGDTLNYSGNGWPAGISLNPATGVISGQIAYGTAGIYTVNIGVCEALLCVSKQFIWTVTHTNRGPNVTPIPNRQDSENDLVSFSVLATDPDGDTVSYSAANLPPGVSINPLTGVISGRLTYTASTNSPYTVSVTATDGSKATTVTFTWTVLNVNRPPTITLPNRSDLENTDVNYPAPTTAQASDPDGDALTFTATGLPNGISMSTAGVLTGHLDFHTAGEYHPTVTVSDGSLSASTQFTWTITNVNAPPVPNTLADQTNSEGQTIVPVQVTASDEDADVLTFSATGLPVGLTMSSSGLVTGSLSFTTAGDYTVIVAVRDGTATRTMQFVWHVLNVNRPPDVLNPGPKSNLEGATITALPISASDPDGDSLMYSATNLPPNLSIDATTGVISGSLSYTSAGTYHVIVTAKDPAGLSDTETFTWIVTDVNRLPLAQPDTRSVTQGQSVVIDVLTNDTDSDTDNTLKVTSVGPLLTGQGLLAITDGGTTVTFTATPFSFIGTATFNYTIDDGKGGTATALVTVNVLTANNNPVCTAAYGGEIWPPNHKRFYVAPINGVTDPDHDVFTITIDAITQDEVLDSTGDGNFSPDGYVQGGQAWIRAERNGVGNKMAGNGRVYEIFFTATDTKGGSCQGSVFWTVPHDQGQRATAIDDGVRYDSTGKVPGTIDKSLIHQKSPRP